MTIFRALFISTFVAAPVVADAAPSAPIRMSDLGICYCPGGARYDQVTESETYPSINACLAKGGREPVLGQGDCSMPSLASSGRQQGLLERALRLVRGDQTQYHRAESATPKEDCRDRRNAMLAKLSTAPVRYTPDGCEVVQGRWIDPYSGEEHSDPDALELGRLVPWEFARTHGAADWSEEKRNRFTHDPANLFVVDAEIHQEREASPFLEWLPQPEEQQCTYLLGVSRLVERYEISLSRHEANDLVALMGDACRG